MFDIKGLLQRGVEKELTNVEEYIFMPERIEMEIDDGQLICVLSSDGRVDLIYSKYGITDARTAARKHPYTPFETELHHGIYDDAIEALIDNVNESIDGKSKYFHSTRVLPRSPALNAAPLSKEPAKTKVL